MAGKKVEGNEQQKRAAAREAKERGQAPSEEAATSGASKQRHHLPRSADYEEKMEARHRGKQGGAVQRSQGKNTP